MSTSAARFEHEVRSANLQTQTPSDLECFQAIDSWVREKEREWVALARACMEVQSRELWLHGMTPFKDEHGKDVTRPFHSWDDWLESAAPSSARTIRWHISIVKGLEPDFDDAEIAQMPKETAKVVRRLSKATRSDPVVREAAKRKRGAFVATVQEAHPEEHIEDEVRKVQHFTSSQAEVIEQAIEVYRALNNPEASEEEFWESLAADYLDGDFDQEEASGISRRERVMQLQAMRP